MLNPCRPDAGYPFQGLCSGGLAYKVASAYCDKYGSAESDPESHLDLVALATIADVAPLQDENRAMVRQGLRLLSQGVRPGIRALKAAAGIKGECGVGTVGFTLAPRINAAGRLGDAADAVRLLLTEDDREAAELAGLLNRLNQERQRCEEGIIAEAIRAADAAPDGPIVLASFRAACKQHGVPASTLTGNGTVYTARFVGGRNGLEHELRRLKVRQKNGKPSHPQTQGKIERFWQTLKKWLAARPCQPATIAELQALLDAFTACYNTQRPHRSLPHRATPATAYHARPKATPGTTGPASHDRVRADRVDADGKLTLRHAGKLHHIGIGRTHARTRVLMLIHDLHIRVINAATGELLRELTLDPDRNYQPTGRPPGPPPGTGRKTRNPEP